MPDRPVAPPAFTTRLPALPPGWQAVVHAILADGTLAILATDADLAGEHRRLSAALRASTAPDPPIRLNEIAAAGTARIWTMAGTRWTEGPDFPLETPFPRLDRFSDGRWLVVASRSRGEPDARVLSRDGVLLDRFTLGDGIEHVAIDAADRIWVGWFDEGMFNPNWREDLGWPPASNGIACFAADGALLPLPIWPAEAGVIADCYALNAMGSGAWTCPYTDFPLVHFRPGEPARWWRNQLAFPHALAIDGTHALVAGGYNEEANRLALIALEGAGDGEEARLLATWHLPLRRLPTPASEWAPVWHSPTLLAGRGDMLHLVDDGIWSAWRVAEVMAASR